jgi:3-hydroxymyristoyl/3-hydroxydecanoyl-(acyl carrier protein) dehydratase
MNDLDTRIVVAADHPSLPGHFPGRPIVPGVVLLDEVWNAIRSTCDSNLRLQAIVSTKFLQAVAPETPVDVQVKFVAETPDRWKARFVASCQGATALEGSFLIVSASDGVA